MRQPRTGRDAGFTLGEVLIVLAIGGVLLALVAGSLTSYQSKNEHRAGARELLSTLRKAQIRSVAEARTYCVRIPDDSATFTMYRGTCGSSVVVGTFETPNGAVRFQNANFVTASVTGDDVYFYPRGSASDGSVQVVRGSTIYTVEVEGLTARVSTNA